MNGRLILIGTLAVTLVGSACDELVLTPRGADGDSTPPFGDGFLLPPGDGSAGWVRDVPDGTWAPYDAGEGPTGTPVVTCEADGELGCPCTFDTDCNTGLCAKAGGGSICTQTCLVQCPEGWKCVNITDPPSPPKYACLPSISTLCRPCSTAADCKTPDDQGAECVRNGDGSGSFCGATCSQQVPCPGGYACGTVALPGGALTQQCHPKSGECPCSPDAIEQGATTQCVLSNELGKCEGTRMCKPTGLTPCLGAMPAPETCNGKDDDCDGQVDEQYGNVGEPCDGPDADDCADGVLACAPDGKSALCDEPGTGKKELCDGVDNDCDGHIDEDFPTLGTECTGPNTGGCTKAVIACKADGSGTECSSSGEGFVEVCNGKDDDCDDQVDEGFECIPGTQETDKQPCGSCGTKSRSRVCTAQCSFPAFADFGECSGEGVCTPGQPETETQSVGCGNCGTKTQQRTRSCTDGCAWGAWGSWSDVGSCGGQGVCSPGQKGSSSACGTCGTGTKTQVCSSACKWTEGTCSDPNPCQCTWNNGTNWRCCGKHKWQFCLKSNVWSTACAAFNDTGNQCP